MFVLVHLSTELHVALTCAWTPRDVEELSGAALAGVTKDAIGCAGEEFEFLNEIARRLLSTFGDLLLRWAH